MKHPLTAPVAIALGLLATLAAVALLTGTRRPDTGLFFGQDFRIYYDAAREATAGGDPYLPYDIGTSFLYHPFSLTVISSLSWMSFRAATWSWVAVSAVAWIATILLIRSALLGIPELAHRRREITVACGVLLFIGPAIQSFYLGQVNTVVVLSTVGAFVASERRLPLLAGAALALAIVLKTLPVLLIAYFLVCRRWREIVAAGVALVAATGAAAMQFGPEVIGRWISTQRLVGDVPYALYPNESFVSVIPRATARVFGGGEFPRQLASGLLTADKALVVIAALALMVVGVRRAQSPASRIALFSAFVVVSVVFSPLVWYHHVALLALPLAVLLLIGPGVVRFVALAALVLVQIQPLLYTAGLRLEPGMLLVHTILLLGCTWLALQEGRRLKTERIGERDRERRGEAAIVPGASTPSEAP